MTHNEDTIYDAKDYIFIGADFRSGLVGIIHPDSHTMRCTVDELREGARSSRVYSELHRRALREIEADRTASVARCAGHRAIHTTTTGFSGPVSDRENPAAHGNICLTEECRCGAKRRTNVNGCHEEEGRWG